MSKWRRIDIGANHFAAEKGKQIRAHFPRSLVHLSVPFPPHVVVFVPAWPILSCPLQCALPSQHTIPEHVLSRVRNIPMICSSCLSLSFSLFLLSCTLLFFIPPKFRARILPLCVPPSSLTSLFSLARTRVNTCARDGWERARMTYAERISLLYILRAAVFAGIYDAAVGILLHLPIYLQPTGCFFFVCPLQHSLFLLFLRSAQSLARPCLFLSFLLLLPELQPTYSLLCLLGFLFCAFTPFWRLLPALRRHHRSQLVSNSEYILSSTSMFRCGIIIITLFFFFS